MKTDTCLIFNEVEMLWGGGNHFLSFDGVSITFFIWCCRADCRQRVCWLEGRKSADDSDHS